MKKTISIIMCFTLIASLISLPASAEAVSVGDTFFLGSYPQSIVEDEAIVSALNEQHGNNEYYSKVEYNGDYYRKIAWADSESYSWYKYEPIEWYIVNTDTGLALSKCILFSQIYGRIYWYYDEFFNAEEKSILLGSDDEDKVFLPRKNTIIESRPGQGNVGIVPLIADGTAYARAAGYKMFGDYYWRLAEKSSSLYGNKTWLVRSETGTIHEGAMVNSTYDGSSNSIGIRPAICVDLRAISSGCNIDGHTCDSWECVEAFHKGACSKCGIVITADHYSNDDDFICDLCGYIIPTKGDIDEDGIIAVDDALIALRIAAGLLPANDKRIQLGDADGDGEITVGDALRILRVAAKLVDSL